MRPKIVKCLKMGKNKLKQFKFTKNEYFILKN
jgi:hypothetical protein